MPDSVIELLLECQAGVDRHKCVICAYQVGVDVVHGKQYSKGQKQTAFMRYLFQRIHPKTYQNPKVVKVGTNAPIRLICWALIQSGVVLYISSKKNMGVVSTYNHSQKKYNL